MHVVYVCLPFSTAASADTWTAVVDRDANEDENANHHQTHERPEDAPDPSLASLDLPPCHLVLLSTLERHGCFAGFPGEKKISGRPATRSQSREPGSASRVTRSVDVLLVSISPRRCMPARKAASFVHLAIACIR